MRFANTLPLFALLLLPLAGIAQPGRGGHHGPPQEALDACLDLSENDACTVIIDDTSTDGVCMPGPRPDLPLACRPDRESKKARRGPPPQAVDACADLAVDDTCSFEHRGQEVEGTCAVGRRDELACKPTHQP